MLPATLVLVVSAVLRLPAPDLTPFGHDEALEAARARPIWYGARPVESEITSWWIPDPAGLLYFFALAEAFERPAVARVELVALANVAAVAVAYAAARRVFGPGVALASGMLYAVNPWAVLFGRQPWVITQPLLTALMLMAALMVCGRRDRRWIVPFFLVGAAQTQTHLLAILYGPPVLLTLVLFARRWFGRELSLGAGMAAIIVAPFALHLWSRSEEIADALARGNRGFTLLPDPSASVLTLWLIGGAHLDAKLGFRTPALEALGMPLLAISALLGLLLLVGIVDSVRAVLRQGPGWEAHALLLIWFLSPLGAMSWQSSAVYIHYVLVLLPTPFLLIALGLRALLRLTTELATPGRPEPSTRERDNAAPPTGVEHTKRAWTAGASVLAVVCAVQVGAVGAFYGALEAAVSAPVTAVSPTEWQVTLNRAELGAKQAGFGELHGLPLRYWQSVADRTKAVAGATLLERSATASRDRAPDVVAVTGIQDAANRDLDRRRKALDYLLGPELEPRFPLEGLSIVPTARDALFLTIPEQDLPRGAARAATRLAEIPLPGTSGATRVWSVRARPPEQIAEPRLRATFQVEGGTRLLGLDLPPRGEPGLTLPIVTYWLVERDDPRPGSDDEPFVELVDASGRPRAYQARGGLPSSQWRAGDLLIQRGSLTLPIDLPAGQYVVTAGLVSRVGRHAGTDQRIVAESAGSRHHLRTHRSVSHGPIGHRANTSTTIQSCPSGAARDQRGHHASWAFAPTALNLPNCVAPDQHHASTLSPCVTTTTAAVLYASSDASNRATCHHAPTGSPGAHRSQGWRSGAGAV